MPQMRQMEVIMDECELITLVSAIACAISKSCSDDDELALLAAIFSQLGDTLATIITKRELNKSGSSCTNPQ